MKFRIMSDLHLEFHRDSGKSFIDSIDPSGADAIILAGDITTSAQLAYVVRLFSEKFPLVYFVLGNHEYYGSNRETVRQRAATAELSRDNVTWLDAMDTDSHGVIGATMWFQDHPGAPKWQMSDFNAIRNLSSWVYEENRMSVSYLQDNVWDHSIVVTHHLPSHRSVASQFSQSTLNAFFVTDVESLIVERQPKLWVHGHTHSSCDYRIGTTRVVCNPFGYLGHSLNPKFDPNFTVEL